MKKTARQEPPKSRRVAKPRLGRPVVPEEVAKGALLSVRFSPPERTALAEAAERDGLKLSAWCRQALLFAAKKSFR